MMLQENDSTDREVRVPNNSIKLYFFFFSQIRGTMKIKIMRQMGMLK